jgi:hypothetical protein
MAIFDDELPEDEDEDDTAYGAGPPLPRGWPERGGFWWPPGAPRPERTWATDGVGAAFGAILRQGHPAFARWMLFDRFLDDPPPPPPPARWPRDVT